ncbi:Ribosome biogenesis regulatory protein [Aphelenchoides besseyi]|nr:Ribosome biogenesis regulatory protein [Aphelenchoides besseyi]KAI6224892.1 Ribosome biogenesis regulatory protein [Aphelenchoides besseyi]
MVNAPSSLPSVEVEKTVEPLVDPGNLLVLDRETYEFDKKSKIVPTNNQLKEISRENVQVLFNSVFKLPRSTVQDAICAELPDQIYGLPREKPVPQQQPLTRWEKFARSKGITSNRDKKVWDEETKTWKPRYGYNRGGKEGDWLIEIPDQKDPNVDYFQERANQKKERVAKNQLQNLRNVKRRMGDRGSSDFGHYKANGANSVPLGERDFGFQVHHAKQATASKGKFQEKLKGEKTPKLGIKRKFEPNEMTAKDEQSKHLAVLEKMSSKKPKISQSRINAAAEYSHQHDEEDGDRKKKSKTPKKVKGTGRKSQVKNGAVKKFGGKSSGGGRKARK